ncbi:MAG TPA: RNA polymerase sigma factor [Verrucomicrobiales bacterium]|nr:RNA polymerase sigma factor [Verrucomicrobiales bacterium]
MDSSPSSPDDKTGSRPNGEAWFATTHWSVVAAAGRLDSRGAVDALEKLCRTYWYPLYAFVRRLGRQPHDAEDLVQGFFMVCFEKNYLDAADQNKGRFRSFLLVALKRFLVNERDKALTRKRGGAHVHVALDALNAEQRYALEPADQLSPDKLYDRRWALTLLEQVMARLESEQASAGRAAMFEELKQFLTSPGRGTPYSELAARFGLSEGALKVAIHRLRKRYRDLLEEEIAHTVSSPEEIQDERRHLLSALSH